MVQICGTYTTVRGQDFVDFYVAMGVEKEKADKAMGSHWTMKVWNDGNQWGGHITCKELPHLNCLEVFTDGVEKCVDHPMFGGKAKVCCTKTGGDGFTTISKSEKFGEMKWVEKYTDEGVTFTTTAGGKTSTEFWQRCIKVDGSYIFEKGENIESYCKAVGWPVETMETSLKSYKLHVCFKGDTLYTKEWMDGHKTCNAMTMDVEGPFRYPDDKEGETPKRRGLVTKAGCGKFLSVVKGPIDEEWTMCFSDCGLVMSATEKKTGQSCKFIMKRFTDFSGTYKMVTTVGMDKFAQCMGMPSDIVNEMMSDCSARMIICDIGNGCQRHQFVSKKFTMDLTMKMNEEFCFHHPILNENVKGVATMNGSTICSTVKTSKGTIVSTSHFNDNFVVSSVCLSGAHIGYKAIFERCCN